MKTENKNILIEYARSIGEAVLIALLIRAFVIEAYTTPTGSMETTILVGDQFFANKFIYGSKVPFTDLRLPGIRNVQRGDVVFFVAPHEPKKKYIKRCIGIPGDIVEIKDKQVYVNGVKIDETYKQHTDRSIIHRGYDNSDNRDNYGPRKVDEKSYFCLGDNRDNSYDSRFWGFVPEKNIIGKGLITYWPFNRFKLIK
jgi:signal peptidase I